MHTINAEKVLGCLIKNELVHSSCRYGIKTEAISLNSYSVGGLLGKNKMKKHPLIAAFFVLISSIVHVVNTKFII